MPTVGPSPVRPSSSKPAPRELSVDEILAIEGRFADAASRAIQAGFDAVEVHGAHGFLLDSFLMGERNRREDAYGGSLDGRMRMLTETCRAVCARVDGTALVGCRISLFNKSEGEFDGGQLAQLVEGLVATGISLLHLSTDGAFRGSFGTERPVGSRVKGLCGLPLIIAGGLRTPHDAERVLQEGIADLAAVGTAMLRDPDWSLHAREVLAA
jgi:2,4-dienoyl-CoA reductase-like NADH-dependent reductase (Old Yellow Enzyme family)